MWGILISSQTPDNKKASGSWPNAGTWFADSEALPALRLSRDARLLHRLILFRTSAPENATGITSSLRALKLFQRTSSIALCSGKRNPGTDGEVEAKMGKLIRLELYSQFTPKTDPVSRKFVNQDPDFKSYKGHHTLLFGDSYFTSIIGPNGSGKSNSYAIRAAFLALILDY